MERRSYERIPASIDARYFYGNMFYTGKVRDLSERGMFISTRKCFPENTMFLLIVRLNNKILQIPAQVKRYIRANGHHDGMGVVLLNPARDYLQFVHGLKKNLQKV